MMKLSVNLIPFLWFSVWVTLFLLRFKVWLILETPVERNARWLTKPWREGKDYLSRLTSNLTIGEMKNDADRYIFSGTFRRRRFTITYSAVASRSFPWRPNWKKSELEFTFSIIQKFWVRLLPETEQTDGEVVTGDAQLDNKYRIHSDQPAIASSFLTEPSVTRALGKMFSFDRLELYRGLARLKISNPATQGFRRSQLDNLMDDLSVIIDFYEAQKLQITVDLQPAGSICPYCREEICEGGEISVACVSCRTVHHLACWNENKQCTTWGCDSTTAR